ncbi:MAG: RagB/SusD family nutrient uptake outer membrane protein [Chitinophagaceae bacterium]
MKKLKNNWLFKSLSICILIAGLSSCKKYLDQVPENALTRDEFFKTEADANSAIIGVYDALQACNDEFLRWGEFRADLITSNTALDPVYLQSFDNTNSVLVWTDPYRLIGRANIVIERVPEIPALDIRFTDQESKEIVSEALFLRSLTYFYLVRTFKEVPLILDAPSSDAVDFLKPKVSADSILNQIEADLITAEKSLPADRGRATETRGRATRGAVNALQADVYLWRAKYAEAAAATKKVLDNISLYSLVPSDNWFKIFSEKNSSESIFEIQYDTQLAEINTLRGLSNTQLVNTTLYNLFTQELDLVRGLNRTYREAGSRQFWKYTGLTIDNVSRASDDPNFIVYRLPDVMLMRAEALIHVGDQEKIEAGVLINEVRKRAGIDSLENLIETTPNDVFNFIILKERAMELSMEGKRWFDLVRMATNENEPDILLSRVVTSRAVSDRAQVRSRLIDPRSWYLPIHRDELSKNPNLVQNPYYK